MMVPSRSPHPLNALTWEELSVCSQLVLDWARNRFPHPIKFNSTILIEPSKSQVLQFECDSASIDIPREALVVIIDPLGGPQQRGSIYEIIVRLPSSTTQSTPSSPSITSWREVPEEERGGQPTITPSECFEVEKIVLEDEQVRFELSKLGIHLQATSASNNNATSASNNNEPPTTTKERISVRADPWSVSYSGEPDHCGRRLIQTFLYYTAFEDDNQYAHPIDFVPVVDINERKVLKLDFLSSSPLQVPQKSSNYAFKFQKAPRKGLKRLEVVQSEGPSFLVNGNHISWQNWSFRLGFNYREGLVLYRIGYEENGKVRPILYRASLVEMAVPYGDPRFPFHRKVAFDVGDYGLGFCANSLDLGCDCLGHIHYFDAVLPMGPNASPHILSKAVCLHEEDAGVLWKHVEYRNGKNEVRRSRRLVVSFISTVVNYEYAFYWHFYLDGTMELVVKATGELSTNNVLPNFNFNPKSKFNPYGTLVAEGVNAQNHQHLFSVRLDPMVDGVENTVFEVDCVPLEPHQMDNPFGNAFDTTLSPLESESEGRRLCDSLKSRSWFIVNENVIHPITNNPVAWRLIPSPAPTLLAHPSSFISKRAQFATKNLWVTAYNNNEKYPAGDYPNQSPGDRGLIQWTSNNRKIRNRDIVIWHTFGVVHIPRPEDFPVMCVEHVGFTLKPFGFFLQNPAVDVPPNHSLASHQDCSSCGNTAKL